MSDPLNRHLAKLRALSSLTLRSAPACAAEVRAVLVRQASAGRAPDGSAWAPTKKGGPALLGAASAIEVRASGSAIVASVTGPYALHSEGRARGGVKREIIPSATVPGPVARAIEAAVTGEFRATMGGAQ